MECRNRGHSGELEGYVRFVSEPPYNLLDRRIENELVPIITWPFCPGHRWPWGCWPGVMPMKTRDQRIRGPACGVGFVPSGSRLGPMGNR